MAKYKNGFIQLQRAAEELFDNDIDAYVVMSQIMFRALRKPSKYNKYKLQINQALIGDYAAIGLTEQRYRDAKYRIEHEYKLASFKGTNRGTIATLLSLEFCDINCESGTGDNEQEERTKNEQEKITSIENLVVYEEKTGTHDSKITSQERTENEQRTTKEEYNNIIKKEEIITTTPLPPKEETIIPIFQNGGGGSSKISYGDIVLHTPKGEQVSISENEVYQHFLRLPYSTDILKQAIKETRETQTPVRDILRYIEAICERLQKKKDLIPSDNKPKNEPPKCTEKGVYGGKYFNF